MIDDISFFSELYKLEGLSKEILHFFLQLLI